MVYPSKYNMRKVFVILLTLVWICGAAQVTKTKKPNIVLIMIDDFGYECISANGSEDYKTPVIDRMAAEGVRFEQCFANPLCTPSRVKIMTGQYNVRNYSKFGELDRSQKTFAHQLRDVGYKTVIAGKWQLGNERDAPHHFGFEQSLLWQHTRKRNRKLDSRYPNPKLELNGKPIDYSNGEYGPDMCTEFICDFIDSNKDTPFFAYYPMILTHCPFDATPDSVDWDSNSFGSTSYKGPGDYNLKKEHFKDMVEYADKLIGKIVHTLDRNGLRENTLIIITGDNGTDTPIMTNFNNRVITGGKGKVADTGTRVPLIINWQGTIKPKVETDELVEFSDIMPTLCDVSGARLPDAYPGDGVSLWPVLSAKGARIKNNIYVWYRGEAWARTIDYGVLHNIENKTYQFQKFNGHYGMTEVAIDSISDTEKTILTNLKGLIDDFTKVREIK